MPGHGGAWLVDQLCQRFPDVAVILATADAQVPGAVSLQRSVVNYIVKPVSRERLLAAVTKALAWRERQAGAQPGRAGDGDSIEAFLDKKLTRGDGGEPE
jgi:FixJ family two-component response regulator